MELPLAIGDLLLAIDVLTDENAELALAISGYGTRIAELETTMGSMSVSGAEAILPA